MSGLFPLLPGFTGGNVAAGPAAGGGSGIITITAASSKSTWDSGTNPFTFNAMSIGIADPNRVVVVIVQGRRTASSFQISALTIGGISAFIGPLDAEPGAVGECVMAYASVPTGTSVSIVVTTTGSPLDMSIFVYSLVGSSALPFILDQQKHNTTTGTASVSLTIPPSGAILAGATMVDGTNGAITWGGVTDFGTEYATTGTGFNDQKGAAHHTISGDTSPATITATSTNTTKSLVATSWGVLSAETAPTVVQAAVTNNEGLSVTLGAAPTTGNLLVCVEFHFNNGTVAGSGWTLIEGTNGTTDGHAILYKIAGVSESATQTPTTFGSGTGSQIIFEIANAYGVGNANGVNPGWLDTYFALADIASAASYTHSETTRATNELIIGAFECYAAQVPTSITGADAVDASASGGSRGIKGWHTAAAAVNSYSFTINNSPNVGGSYVAILIRPKQA